MLRTQLQAGEPLKKRLWQQLVKAKIRNQAICLQLSDRPEAAAELLALLDRVTSGDTGNVEAVAAQRYFPALFGDGFTRAADSGCNAALNYGYAILRGCVARALAVYGFLPALGLHHRSELNPFNLADDLMEPFRPVVDLMEADFAREEDALTSEDKRRLFNCLNLDIVSGGQHHSVSYAIERTVQSLGKALDSKTPALLLPELQEPSLHSYE